MSKKKSLILSFCFAFTLFIGSTGIAQEAQQIDPEMMEAYMKLQATNENHEFLKNFVGEWDVATTLWMEPGAEPFTIQNKAKAELIFGGRFLKIEIKGMMFGQPYEGIQIMGYDNQQKKNISFWIDNSSTSFYLTSGSREKGKNVITETAIWLDPMSGEDMKVKLITTLISKDEYSLVMIMILPDGSEFKSMESLSKRKK
jgi:hypothetical protein